MVVRATLYVCLLGASFAAFSQPPSKPSFDVATIKPHVFTGRGRLGVSVSPNGRVTVSNVSLKNIILTAYAVRDYQVMGGPAWLAMDRYDIAATTSLERSPTTTEVQLMLQALLADRFHLKLHRETRELSVYALVVEKKGAKLKQSAADSKSSVTFMRGQLTESKVTMTQFALQLAGQVGRPVVDETDLRGDYDFELKWTPDESLGQNNSPADVSGPQELTGPSVFTAIREQLGLRLDSRKGPVEILMIGHADKPTEN
jgi:uncharacterized protein (TIGR03435 family)